MQVDLFNQNLVQNVNGELLVSSLVIAENVKHEHRTVLQLIRQNLKDFEEFGGVTFQMQPFETNGGVQTREIVLLNENQSTLLITYMRNSEIVKRFKIALVKAFAHMKNKLTNQSMPTHLETARLLVETLEREEKLLLENKELERKNNILMHTKKRYTATEIAKELGMKSAIELNKKLSDMGIQYKVNQTWVFYSKYSDLGYESIKQDILDNGTVAYSRKFTQDGRDFILRLFTS
jgi:phage regulator Rha-like protein